MNQKKAVFNILWFAFLNLIAIVGCFAAEEWKPEVCFHKSVSMGDSNPFCTSTGSVFPDATWANAVSSIELKDGAKVTLYKWSNQNVNLGTYVTSARTLKNGVNDTASSYKLELPRQKPRVCFYSDENYAGTESCYDKSVKSGLGSVDNTFSSMIVEGEAFVVTYKDVDYGGDIRYGFHDMAKFEGRTDAPTDSPIGNDEVSSFKLIPYSEGAAACFYEKRNMEGNQWCDHAELNPATTTNPGSGRTSFPSRFDNTLSSYRLYGNTYVMLIQDPLSSAPDTGRMRVAMGDGSRLSLLEDQVSSYELFVRTTRNFACLYERRGFHGDPLCAESDGKFTSYDNLNHEYWTRDLEDTFSSLQISGRAKVLLGKDRQLTSNTEWVYDTMGRLYESDSGGEFWNYNIDWEDVISAFKVAVAPEWGADYPAAEREKPSWFRRLVPVHNKLATSYQYSSWPSTHNSFNANEYVSIDHNQDLTVAGQLDLGARQIEFDSHASGGQPIACHAADCTTSGGRVDLARLYAEMANFLKGADDDEVIFLYNEIRGGTHFYISTNDEWAKFRRMMVSGLHRHLYRTADAWRNGELYKDDTPPSRSACIGVSKEVSPESIRRQGARVLIHMEPHNGTCDSGFASNYLTEFMFLLKGNEDKETWAFNGCSSGGKDQFDDTLYWRQDNHGGGGKKQLDSVEIAKFTACGGAFYRSDHFRPGDARKDITTENGENRLSAMMWSLDPQSIVTNGFANVTGECTKMEKPDSGYNFIKDQFFLDGCSNSYPYLCLDTGKNWKKTVAEGAWGGGAQACAVEYPGSTFSVPQSHNEMRRAQQANIFGTNDDYLWLNFRRWSGYSESFTRPQVNYVVEAESASLSTSADVQSCGQQASGGKVVKISADTTGAALTFNNISVSASGSYVVQVYYQSSEDDNTIQVGANGNTGINTVDSSTYSYLLGDTGDDLCDNSTTFAVVSAVVGLNEGANNSITIHSVDLGENNSLTIDKIILLEEYIQLADSAGTNCVSVLNSGVRGNGNLDVVSCDANDQSQLWRTEQLPTGKTKFHSKVSDICLDLKFGSASSGTELNAWNCTSSDSQVFYTETSGAGVRIKAANSGLNCIERTGTSTKLEANTCSSDAKQVFTFKAVPPIPVRDTFVAISSLSDSGYTSEASGSGTVSVDSGSLYLQDSVLATPIEVRRALPVLNNDSGESFQALWQVKADQSNAQLDILFSATTGQNSFGIRLGTNGRIWVIDGQSYTDTNISYGSGWVDFQFKAERVATDDVCKIRAKVGATWHDISALSNTICPTDTSSINRLELEGSSAETGNFRFDNLYINEYH